MVSAIATDTHAVYRGKSEGILLFWPTAVFDYSSANFYLGLKAKLTK